MTNLQLSTSDCLSVVTRPGTWRAIYQNRRNAVLRRRDSSPVRCTSASSPINRGTLLELLKLIKRVERWLSNSIHRDELQRSSSHRLVSLWPLVFHWHVTQLGLELIASKETGLARNGYPSHVTLLFCLWRSTREFCGSDSHGDAIDGVSCGRVEWKFVEWKVSRILGTFFCKIRTYC